MNGSGRSLSDLHDDVLIHILCFLSTKEAIQTSILSKRWQYLWTSIPILDFTHESDFMNFIEKAISLRESSSKITKFKLSTESCAFSPPFLPSIWCNVEECELARVNLPPHFCLPPQLKMLKLQSVNFYYYKQSDHNVVIECPMLEHLNLEYVYWVNAMTVRIVSSKLQRLIITEAYYLRGLHIGSEFEIHARDLAHFSYSGPFYFDYYIFSSVLEGVTINAYIYNANPTHVSSRLLKLLRRVSNVQKLVLGYYSVPILNETSEFHDDMPKFSNLRHLELDAVKDSMNVMDEVWLKMLKGIPHLKRLVLTGGINDSWLLRHICLYVSSSTTTRFM